MDILKEIVAAESRIRDYVRLTPAEDSHVLGRAGGCRATLKLENYQVTGSFKIRGALNKLLALGDEADRGVIAASSGNHGAALSYALEVLGRRGTVVVPESCSPTKLEAIRAHGAEVVVKGHDSVVAEIWARQEARRRGIPYVSPYNDALVVAGQGTIGVELARQRERIDAVYVAVGGGGLVSGVATYLRSLYPGIEIVGCSPANSAVMYESIRAGRLLELESRPTLSDGTAGGVEADAVTFDICRREIDRFILVSEAEIEEAMRLVIGSHHMLVEGAAAVPVAAFLKDGRRQEGKNVVLVLCGANVGAEVLRRVLNEGPAVAEARPDSP